MHITIDAPERSAEPWAGDPTEWVFGFDEHATVDGDTVVTPDGTVITVGFDEDAVMREVVGL